MRLDYNTILRDVKIMCVLGTHRRTYAAEDIVNFAINNPIIGGSPYSKQIHQSQYKWIMRQLVLGTTIIKELSTKKLNQKKFYKLRKLTGNRFQIEVICAFYNQRRQTSWWMELRRLPLLDVNILSWLLYGAIGLDAKLENQYRTSTVMGILHNCKATDDFSMMPILADALQDADFPHESYLTHLRTTPHFSLGDWIFRAAGLT